MRKFLVLLLVLAFIAPALPVQAGRIDDILMAKRLPFHQEYNVAVDKNVNLSADNVKLEDKVTEYKGLAVFLGIVIVGVISHFAGQNGSSGGGGHGKHHGKRCS